jgi:hypothetical protein
MFGQLVLDHDRLGLRHVALRRDEYQLAQRAVVCVMLARFLQMR